MGAASIVHLILFGDGTHYEGDTDTTHFILGALTHNCTSVGEIGERSIGV
jgi:hypothetical protein